MESFIRHVLCCLSLFFAIGCSRALEIAESDRDGSIAATGCRAIGDAKTCASTASCVAATSCCGNFVGCYDPKDVPTHGQCPPGVCVTACLGHATPDVCDADVNCHSTYTKGTASCPADQPDCAFAFAGCEGDNAVCEPEPTGSNVCALAPDCSSADGLYVNSYVGSCASVCVRSSECAQP